MPQAGWESVRRCLASPQHGAGNPGSLSDCVGEAGISGVGIRGAGRWTQETAGLRLRDSQVSASGS